VNLVSFIIASHRAPASIEATLRSIIAQRSAGEAEIVVVNNGFGADREATLALLLATARPALDVRIVREARPGLGFARRAGFLAARGEYAVLLDDDNTLDEAFLVQLRTVIGRDGPLACICPAVHPVWEGGTPPPAWLRDFGRLCLSYNKVDDKGPRFERRLWPAQSAKHALRPPGGGMIIHRRAFEAYVAQADDSRLSLGRTPDSLHGCEDEDLFGVACDLKWPMAYDANLRCNHHISTAKWQAPHLRKLNFEMCQSYGLLARLKGPRSALSSASLAILRLLASPFRSRGRWLLLELHVLRELGFLAGLLGRAPRT
jgi:glycosyltransferase involved in cell wall biosynthesis